jgi:4-amino-4-deoxy-L-arabinose transferase-like glycosyltransferase
LLVLVLVSSSWYLAGLWEQRLDLLQRQIVNENFSRFVGDIHTMSPLYYLKPLLLNSGPLSMLTIIAVFGALRVRASRGAGSGSAIDQDLRVYVLALFWVLTVVFFSLAAYKRRAYLLPLWPPGAALLVWWLDQRVVEQRRQLAKGAVAALCGGLIMFNLLYIPYAERAECGSAGYRQAASVINRVVPYNAPLFINDSGAESAPLLFYLDRTVPVLDGTLANTPAGYVLVAESAWKSRPSTTALRPLATVRLERRSLVLVESQPGSTVAEIR